MVYRNRQAKVAQFSFGGTDKKGIIAHITQFFYQNDCNILDIDQRIFDDYLIMNTLVDCSDVRLSWVQFLKNLEDVVYGKLRMQYKVTECGKSATKNIAVLVSKESHCLEKIISDIKSKKIKGNVRVIIGNHGDLEGLARKNKIPFFYFSSEKKKEHEQKILDVLDKNDIDLVVLARYMQVLSPDFVFRYEGRIINIHPSLLPAFPGPRSYHQAFNKGVEFVGVTAHFVTTDLDEGPIICQEAFRVRKVKDSVENYLKHGRMLEAKALARAIKLFCDDKLSLRRGKVIMGKQPHGFYKMPTAHQSKTTQEFS